MADLILLVNASVTMFMTGVIWYVQIVHYPLFAGVGHDRFISYENSHSRLTTRVVAPPMLLELGTAVLLVLVRPASSPPLLLWLGLALVGVIWTSTALLQVPRHTRLGSGFDISAHRFLVLSNWVRTTAWTVRTAVSLTLLYLSMTG